MVVLEVVHAEDSPVAETLDPPRGSVNAVLLRPSASIGCRPKPAAAAATNARGPSTVPTTIPSGRNEDRLSCRSPAPTAPPWKPAVDARPHRSEVADPVVTRLQVPLRGTCGPAPELSSPATKKRMSIAKPGVDSSVSGRRRARRQSCHDSTNGRGAWLSRPRPRRRLDPVVRTYPPPIVATPHMASCSRSSERSCVRGCATTACPCADRRKSEMCRRWSGPGPRHRGEPNDSLARRFHLRHRTVIPPSSRSTLRRRRCCAIKRARATA
jgi:hypothetical protein